LISAGFGASFSAGIGLKANLPWPIPDVDIAGSVNTNPHVKNDLNFTADLGNTFSNSSETTLASVGVDVVAAGAKVDVNAELDTFFTPQSISGHIKATHLESGNTLPDIPVSFDSSNLEITKDVTLTPTIVTGS